MQQDFDDDYWDELRDRRIAAEGERLLREGLIGSLPEDAAFVRYVGPDEFATTHAECLRQQGFDATETADGGISHGAVPPEQAQALHEALHRCNIMYPVHPRYRERLTDEQRSRLYDYFVNELVPCLQAEGRRIGPVPSRETFIATFYTDESWHPYHSVGASNQREWARLNERCPQRPPIEELYGDEPGDG